MSMDAQTTGLEGLRRLFARSDEHFAGADMSLTRRTIGLMTLLTSAITGLFMLLAPPIRSPLGWFGLAIGLAVVAGGLRGGRRLLSPDCSVGFDQLLLWSYLGLARIVLLNWLAGGGYTSYQSIAILSVIAGAGVQPPRRGAGYLLALVPALGAPLIYQGWSESVFVRGATDLLICWAIGTMVIFYMARLRAQRLQMRAGEAEALQLALVDSLTQLGNRRAFDEALAAEVARSRRSGAPLSVLLVDLDGLKRVNDFYGHLEGDRALRQVGRALAFVVREADRCFRWAGDEFAAILPDTTAEAADNVRRRLVEQVRSSCFTSHGEPLVVSCGVAECGDSGALAVIAAADDDLLAQKAERRPAQFVR
jgi:diguanylate cyclase (GGDEF)-like protein